MTENSKSPLYSLVTFGRNDNYNPDFLYRLQTMLNFNAKALEKIGRLDAVEFVVVDWGSAVPLREVLALEVPAASATMFLEISPETAARLADAPSGMNGPRAQNAGVRRARGQYIGIQGADLLMTSAGWRALLLALEDRHDNLVTPSTAVLQIPRRIVPWSFVARQPSLDRWEQWLMTCSQVTPNPPRFSFPAVGGGMGIIILHRDLWRDAKGYDEIFTGWGYSDIDLVLRVSAYHPWLDAGTYGVVCYKMEHAPKGLRGRLFNGRGNTISVNPPWITTSLTSRFADWGLPQLELQAKKAEPRASHGDATSTGGVQDRWQETPWETVDQYIDKDVSHHVNAALGGAIKKEADLETLHMLSWFGLRKFPVNYLEIGLRQHFGVRAIATACPSVDIFVLESEEKDSDGAMHKSVDICADLLWKWGHKGYFRASAGNLLDNLERLKRSFIGPFDLEAILLRLEEPGDVELLSPALQAVVHGGLLAIHAARPELLDTALKAYDSLSTNAHIMRGHSGRTAFLFVNTKEPRDPEPQISPHVRLKLLRIPMRVRLRAHAGRLRRRLRKLTRLGKVSK